MVGIDGSLAFRIADLRGIPRIVVSVGLTYSPVESLRPVRRMNFDFIEFIVRPGRDPSGSIVSVFCACHLP